MPAELPGKLSSSNKATSSSSSGRAQGIRALGEQTSWWMGQGSSTRGKGKAQLPFSSPQLGQQMFSETCMSPPVCLLCWPCLSRSSASMKCWRSTVDLHRTLHFQLFWHCAALLSGLWCYCPALLYFLFSTRSSLLAVLCRCSKRGFQEVILC